MPGSRKRRTRESGQSHVRHFSRRTGSSWPINRPSDINVGKRATAPQRARTHDAAIYRGSATKQDQVKELLLQSLEHERGGVKVYETALQCVLNVELKEEFEKYLEQTRYVGAQITQSMMSLWAARDVALRLQLGDD